MKFKNQVSLIGRAVADAEVKMNKDNQIVARFNIAVGDSNGSSIEDYIENTQFFSVVAKGDKAKLVDSIVRRGANVLIDGELVNSYIEGREVTEVLVNDISRIWIDCK